MAEPEHLRVQLDFQPNWRRVWLAGCAVFALAMFGAITGVFVADFLLRLTQ